MKTQREHRIEASKRGTMCQNILHILKTYEIIGHTTQIFAGPDDTTTRSSLLGPLWHAVIMLLHNFPLANGLLGQVARPFAFALPLPPDEADKVGDHLMTDLGPFLERIVHHRRGFANDLPSLKVRRRRSPLRAGDLRGLHVFEWHGVKFT